MKYLIFAFLGLVLASSCNKDEEVTRNDFVATWDAEESIIISGQTQTDDYTFVIAPDPGNSDRLIMTGFAKISINLTATVNGSNFTTEEIALEFGEDNEDATFRGSGTLNGNTLTYEYTIVTETETFEWNGTATKQ